MMPVQCNIQCYAGDHKVLPCLCMFVLCLYTFPITATIKPSTLYSVCDLSFPKLCSCTARLVIKPQPTHQYYVCITCVIIYCIDSTCIQSCLLAVVVLDLLMRTPLLLLLPLFSFLFCSLYFSPLSSSPPPSPWSLGVTHLVLVERCVWSW